MPSKTPHTNGNEPVENGVNGTKDVEMKDDAPTSLKGGKGKKAKEGEEEMTVVVPPSKGSKLSAPPPKDNDGDVAMDGSEEADGEDAGAVKIDPVAKAVSGSQLPFIRTSLQILTHDLKMQTLRTISLYWNGLLRCSMLDSPFGLSGQFPPSASASTPIS
jgi:26S proteasome regulatory subunit N3